MSEQVPERAQVFRGWLDGTVDEELLRSLDPAVRKEAEAVMALARAAREVDLDDPPEFDDDPVAERLGLRAPSGKAPVAGRALSDARRRAGLDRRRLAILVSGAGTTTDEYALAQIEEAWSTSVPEGLAGALASALGVSADDLSRQPRPPVVEPTDLAEVRAVLEDLDPGVSVEDDAGVAALSPHVASQLLLRYLDLRIRVCIRPDVASEDGLADPAVAHQAKALLRHTDASAVVLVAGDPARTAQVYEPADVLGAIATPNCGLTRPGPSRLALGLSYALCGYLEEASVTWDAVVSDSDLLGLPDPDEGAADIARDVLRGIREDGRRARIAEKKGTWQGMPDDLVEGLAGLVTLATRGELRTAEECRAHLDELVGRAA